jgi:hypothetical protein
MAGPPGEQGVPVVGPEERPGGHRLDASPGGPEGLGHPPRLRQPPHLLLACAAIVALRHRDGDVVASGNLRHRPLEAPRRRHEHADGLHVGEAFEGVRAAPLGGVGLAPMIQEAVAGEIVIDPEHLRRKRVIGDGP